ncbi:MAG: EF-hand domain-containing protein [Proteobacteria bacterium]|nr:EF-hand domain-containing protein [Pseudomonadota bacterium]
MKHQFISTALILVATIGCKEAAQSDRKTSKPESEEASPKKEKTAGTEDTRYVTDMSDAASSVNDKEAKKIDSNVGNDISEERISFLAKRMMKHLDDDKNSQLSLEEFRSGPKKFAEKEGHKFKSAPTDMEKFTAKIQERLQKEFAAHSGSDKMLSEEELKDLLLAQAPKVSEFRRRLMGPGEPHHGGQQPDQPGMPSPDEVFKKFDKNNDGNLTQEEFEDMMKARKAQHGAKPGPDSLGRPEQK